MRNVPIGKDSEAFQAAVSADSAVGTNHIVWRCSGCGNLIEQGDLPADQERARFIHRPPEHCDRCGAEANFQLIDED